MSDPLTVELAITDRGPVVHAFGVLDAAGGRKLRGLGEQFVRLAWSHVLIDLGGVTKADLAGLRALQEFQNGLNLAGADLAITNPVLAAYPTDWQSVRHSKNEAA